MQKLNDLYPADQVRNNWQIRPEVGVMIDDITQPEYWANVANKMTVGDEISVFAKDATYFAKLLVLAVSDRSTGQTVRAQWAKVFVLNKVNIGDAETAITFDEIKYDLKWRGIAKFSVVRKSDKSILQDGFSSRNDAAKWANAHETTVAA